MGEASRNDIATAIRGFYDAAVGEIDWSVALSNVTAVVPGVFATFEVLDKTEKRYVEFRTCANAPEVTEAYLEHFFKLNPRLPGVLNRRDLSVMGDYDFLSEAEMKRSEFYNDFLGPNDLRYCAGVRVLDTQEMVGTFSVQRSPRQGHISEQDLSLLRHLQPHMREAARVHLKFGSLIQERDSFEAALHWLADGVVVLSRGGHIRYVNPAAADIFREDDGLSISRNAMNVASTESKSAFGRAIKAALTARRGQSDGARHLVVPRTSGGPPYVLTFAPISEHGKASALARDCAVLVFIRDPARPHVPAAEVLKRAYALSNTEVGVALALIGGMTATEIADVRQVSLATVRTQLQSILRKTGQRRQSDLIKFLAGFVSPAR